MKNATRIPVLLLLISISMFLISCSKTKSPVEPPVGNQQEPIAIAEASPNRTLLAVYDAAIDLKAGTFTITPNERSADYHYPLTRLYPDVLTITRYGFTPNFWADIKISHPLPNSGIDAFDPSVIAILPANPGVSMSYPTLGVLANNSVVLNPDGYTKLYDNLGGSIPGNTNPFLAYFKHVEYRRWFSSGTGFTSDTRRWEMNIDGFGGPMTFKLVVDISLNYPDPPQRVIDNAPEPVQIEARIGDGLTPSGDSTSIEVTLLDWQGQFSIGNVFVESPELFNNTVLLAYSEPGQNPNEYIYKGTVSNELFAPVGDYKILVSASDQSTGIALLGEFNVSVSGIPQNPIEIPVPWLSFATSDVCVNGNYAFTTGDFKGMHIFDISDPVNPTWVNKVDGFERSSKIIVQGDYAYVASGSDGLNIIDINPPQTASIIKTVASQQADDVNVEGGYAYLADRNEGLKIIDIEPPEEAFLVSTFSCTGAMGVFVSDGYAYVADWDNGLRILDVHSPQTVSEVKLITLDDGGSTGTQSVYVTGGYAYVLYVWDQGGPHPYTWTEMYIIDITPPEAASITRQVTIRGYSNEVAVSNGYAYVPNNADVDETGLQIIDVDPPEDAYIVNQLAISTGVDRLALSGNYAYVTSTVSGLLVVNISDVNSAFIENSVDSLCYTRAVCVTDENAYVMGSGLYIVDNSPPETSEIIKSTMLDAKGFGTDVQISNGYAYCTDFHKGLTIVDIEPPESAEPVSVFESTANGVFVSGGYAYVADERTGLQIVDIDPPETPSLVKTIDTTLGTFYVFVDGGYAFVNQRYSSTTWGMSIVDIDPPELAHVVKEVPIADGFQDIFVSNGYAYLATMEGNLHIVDVDPVDTAEIVKTVDMPGWADTIFVSGGYAYVCVHNVPGDQVNIIDINPVDAAYIVNSFTINDIAWDIKISDGYAYIVLQSGEMQIFKLW